MGVNRSGLRAAPDRSSHYEIANLRAKYLVTDDVDSKGIPEPIGRQHPVDAQFRSGIVVDGQWKLIDNSLDGGGPYELYDLNNDPKENRNLGQDARQTDRVQAYREMTAKWRADRVAPVRIAGMSMPDYAQISEEEQQKALAATPGERAARPARTQHPRF